MIHFPLSRRVVSAAVLAVLAFCWMIHVPVPAGASDAEPKNTFRVLDIGERTYDDGPAIAVILSAPLDPTVRHDAHLRVSDQKEMLKSAWVLSSDGRTLWFPNVEPETNYSVTVLDTLAAADSRRLGQRITKSVTTRSVTPIVSFASEGFLLPANVTKGLPVVTVNVPSVEVEFFRLDEAGLLQYINWENTTSPTDSDTLSRVKEYGKFVFSGRFDLDAPPNRRKVSHLPVENIEALKEPGIYMAVLRQPGEYSYEYQTTYFVVTDIALHARIYARESVIFAQSLTTGAPMPGVRLRFFDNASKVKAEGRCDETGRFTYQGRLTTDIGIIMASHEGRMGVLPLRIPAVDMSEFDVGQRPFHHREVFVYSPRDIYRPGEIATFSALLRDEDGRPLQAPPLTVKVIRPDGKESRSFVWRPEKGPLDALNYYETEIDIPSDDLTGLWHLKVWDEPSAPAPAADYAFHVEDFLPERMKLTLTPDPETPAGTDDLTVGVEGAYLYGAPAAGNKIATRVRVKAIRQLEGMPPGFEFGDIADEGFQDRWDMEEGQLDDEGRAELAIENRWKEIKSPVSVRTVVDLFESGGRPVTRAADVVAWPGEILLGIRPLFKEKNAEEGMVRFEILRVGRDGKPLAFKGLETEIIREERDYYWEYSPESGWRHHYSEKNYGYRMDALPPAPAGPLSHGVQLGRGQYVFSVRDPETGLKASYRFRVGWWWAGDDGETARPDKVVLTLDKPAYHSGDVAVLKITPPHAGEALVLVEGDSLLWSKRIPMPAEGATVEIPLLAGWERHDLHVSTLVFRPSSSAEKITPNRAVGLIHLPLERQDRRLNIALVAPEKTRPEQTVTISVTGPAPLEGGQPVFVTLATVDVGILSITDFKTPDPFAYFFGRRRFSVDAYDAYARVIEHFEGNMAALRFGGDADLTAGKRPENTVRLLTLFSGPVKLDESGKASIPVNLPDFNGRARLMAVAFDGTRFGMAETEMTIASPVVTQLSMPRFLAPGDRSEFTLDVHNMSGQTQNLRIAMTADGPVELFEGQKEQALEDGKKTTLRFPVLGKAASGLSTVRLILDGTDIHLDRNWNLGVRAGWPAVTRKTLAVVEPGASAFVSDRLMADLMPATVEAALKISPNLPIDFAGAMRGLIGYPYGCLEQTSSRAWPLVFATPDNITRFRLPPITAEERLKRVNQGVERLSGMQLASGGFGLWNKTSPEEGWLTAYVSDFLLTARDAGFAIPPGMLDKALARLEAYLKSGPPLPEYLDNKDRPALQYAIAAQAAYVLSRVNRAPLGTLRVIHDELSPSADSCLPLVHMSLALTRMGDPERAKKALETAISKRPADFSYWGHYGSPIRDLAMTVALLADERLTGQPGYGGLISELDKALRTRTWLSTQEKFALFRAGVALDQKSGKPWAGNLKNTGPGAEPKPLRYTEAHVRDLTSDTLATGLTFTSESDRPLYMSTVVTGYPSVAPVKDDGQISITRELLDQNGKPLERKEFHVGELILVHLSVAAKTRIPDGLVVDLLPAGFEGENQNLKNAARLEDVLIGEQSIAQMLEESPVLHEEYRDDRYVAAVTLSEHQVTHIFYLARVVSPGTYQVPPPFAESMYRPEIRGVGTTPPPITVINQGRKGDGPAETAAGTTPQGKGTQP